RQCIVTGGGCWKVPTNTSPVLFGGGCTDWIYKMVSSTPSTAATRSAFSIGTSLNPRACRAPKGRRGRGGNQFSRRCPLHRSWRCPDVRAGRRDLRVCRPEPAQSRPVCGGDVGHAGRQHEDGAVLRTVSAQDR